MRDASGPAVFLDRDGGIIENRADYVRTSECRFEPQGNKAIYVEE